MNVRAFKKFLARNGWRCTLGIHNSYFVFEKENICDKLKIYYHGIKIFSIELHSRLNVITIPIRKNNSFVDFSDVDFSDIVEEINKNMSFNKSSFENFYNKFE